MTTQFKKGIIELCVLKIVKDEEMYGFQVMEELSRRLDVNENTIYPLLRRLTKQGLFTTYLKENDQGGNRKYYQITDEGNVYLEDNIKEWYNFTDVVDEILGGKNI